MSAIEQIAMNSFVGRIMEESRLTPNQYVILAGFDMNKSNMEVVKHLLNVMRRESIVQPSTEMVNKSKGTSTLISMLVSTLSRFTRPSRVGRNNSILGCVLAISMNLHE
jgi:hypothetical protein